MRSVLKQVVHIVTTMLYRGKFHLPLIRLQSLAADRNTAVRLPEGTAITLRPHSTHTVSGAHQAPRSMGTVGTGAAARASL
jgi:hypothetical protein